MNRRRIWAALAAAAGVTAAVSPAARAELHITPTVGVSETWTDNYFLAAPGEPKDEELVTRAYARLGLSQQSERMRAGFTYDIDTVLHGPAKSATYQNGRLDLGGEVLRDWFFVDAFGAYGQYSIDPQIRRNPDHVFPARDSLTDVGTGSLTGSLRHDLGSVHFDASYTAGAVRYAKKPDSAIGTLQDSNSRDTRLILRSLGESRLSWSGTYEEQRVDYDGGLDQSSWAAGFAWRYPRGEFRLMAGRSVYGDTYDASLTANGRIASVDFSYHEQTTTQIQQFLPSLATDSTGKPIVVGGNTVISGLDDPFARLTPDVFRQQELRGRVSLVGRLTSIELELRSERRSYLISGVTDTVHGANVTMARALGPRSRAQLAARYDTVTLANADRFHDQVYSLSFNRQLGQRLQLVASASRAKLDSADGYVANWVALALQMSFGGAGGIMPTAPGIDLPTQSR